MELGEVDLHIHTTCSDGQYSVDEILEKAKEKGLKIIGIVDHDTIKHFEVLSKSKVAIDMLLNRFQIFAGVEFSCKIGSLKMHLIGYSINYKDEKIVKLIEKADELRLKKLYCYIDRLKSLDINLSDEQVARLEKIQNVGRVEIAKCLVENGVVKSVDKAFISLLKSDPNAKQLKLDAREVIQTVKETGGMMVIAHPYQIMRDNKLTEEQTVEVWKTLIELGVEGMECYYSSYTKEQIQKLVSFASNNKLNITMGSDFHGEKIKPKIKLGQIMLSE